MTEKNLRKFNGFQKRTTEQRETDRVFCTNLFLRGRTYGDIASQLNEKNKNEGRGYTITATMVYKDMQKLLVEWKRERMANIDDYVTQELRKLDKIEAELWDAWETSKTGRVKEKKRTSARPRKVLIEDEKTADYYGYDETSNETSAGNPRFLDLLLNVQQRRAKLLGYDAPIKIDIPGIQRDEEKEKYDVNVLPKDLLFAVVDKLQDAKFAAALIDKEQ